MPSHGADGKRPSTRRRHLASCAWPLAMAQSSYSQSPSPRETAQEGGVFPRHHLKLCACEFAFYFSHRRCKIESQGCRSRACGVAQGGQRQVPQSLNPKLQTANPQILTLSPSPDVIDPLVRGLLRGHATCVSWGPSPGESGRPGWAAIGCTTGETFLLQVTCVEQIERKEQKLRNRHFGAYSHRNAHPETLDSTPEPKTLDPQTPKPKAIDPNS